ncbi:hypothetical protein VTK73DRAFT_9269 [Phialemonium thermophilum]|uniref:Major facilitator superfamily (MFS) profile domain-containing protein n=1 Tax=Phialemonium thermophilum TaxID=223376 RepID=A0ABR3W414_9PEZI
MTLLLKQIADLFFVHQRGTLNALYLTAVMIGSFLTPMAAGVQAQNEGWRWSYYTLAIFLTVLFVVCCFAYEETKYVVPDASGASDHDAAAAAAAAAGPQKSDAQEERHDGEDAKSQRLEPHTSPASDHQRRPPPLKTYRQRLRLITKTPEPFWKLLYFPVYVAFLPHVFFTSLQYAAGVAWLVISSATIAMVLPFPPYNFGPAAIGYMGVAPFIGNLVGSFYGGVLSDWAITRLARRNKGYFEPEMRLYHLLPPALFMAGGLIMQGATFQRVRRVPFCAEKIRSLWLLTC